MIQPILRQLMIYVSCVHLKVQENKNRIILMSYFPVHLELFITFIH